MTASERSSDSPPSVGRGASLESVVATAELDRRETRVPDYERENRAYSLLLEEIASSTGDPLKRLVETALELCDAHSAGISLLRQAGDETVFHWRAVAGRWAGFVNGVMPRALSPCGTVLDRNDTVLFRYPHRHYPFPEELMPPCVEALLIPFHIGDRPVGTIWIVSHDEERRFDREDERIIRSICRFAATACQILEVQTELRAAASENAELYGKAKKANQARDDFFASLSHELKTPLTSILGWAALLEYDPTPEVVSQAARAITSSATLQSQLVNDLLDISRMMTGKFAISTEPVDFSSVVEESVKAIVPAASKKQIDVRFEASPPLMISGDRVRLRQVAGNLLSNALKFTPVGGRIEVSVDRDEEFATLRVADSGEGIPHEFLQRVFDRYSQVGERRHGGMGLGLSIVRHIVELHGGNVSAESSGEGQGSTFTVRMPVAGGESRSEVS